MPAYSFICRTCGFTFEQHLPYDGSPEAVRCPYGHTDVRRLYSPPTIVFKGTGWYRTDSRPQPQGEKVGDPDPKAS